MHNAVSKILYCLSITAVTTSGCNTPPPSHEVITGKASKIFAHGTDLVIYIEGDKSEASYYLNRYLDGGASLDSLQQLVLNKEVRIQYMLHYTILNLQGKSRPIDTLYVDGRKLY